MLRCSSVIETNNKQGADPSLPELLVGEECILPKLAQNFFRLNGVLAKQMCLPFLRLVFLVGVLSCAACAGTITSVANSMGLGRQVGLTGRKKASRVSLKGSGSCATRPTSDKSTKQEQGVYCRGTEFRYTNLDGRVTTVRLQIPIPSAPYISAQYSTVHPLDRKNKTGMMTPAPISYLGF